jgi:hypothetical protein
MQKLHLPYADKVCVIVGHSGLCTQLKIIIFADPTIISEEIEMLSKVLLAEYFTEYDPKLETTKQRLMQELLLTDALKDLTGDKVVLCAKQVMPAFDAYAPSGFCKIEVNQLQKGIPLMFTLKRADFKNFSQRQ